MTFRDLKKSERKHETTYSYCMYARSFVLCIFGYTIKSSHFPFLIGTLLFSVTLLFVLKICRYVKSMYMQPKDLFQKFSNSKLPNSVFLTSVLCATNLHWGRDQVHRRKAQTTVEPNLVFVVEYKLAQQRRRKKENPVRQGTDSEATPPRRLWPSTLAG